MVLKQSYFVEVIPRKVSLVTVLPTKSSKVIRDRHLRSNSSGHVYFQFQILEQILSHLTVVA